MFDIKALMIGPKAENLNVFKQMIIEALDDHLFWRRNFYPQDAPIVTSSDRNSPSFAQFHDRLRDLLFEFLSSAKEGVPFFSSRYIGHMNTDLLIPALIGYFASMLYNQNNVAGESAPMTARLEQEVMVMLAEMVGFPIYKDETGANCVAGYITSGGTTANIYALWVTRNLRTWPIALRMAMANASTPEEKHARNVLSRWKPFSESDLSRPFGSMLLWDLLNLPASHLMRFRQRCFKYLSSASPRRFPTSHVARRFIESWVQPWTLASMGLPRFRLAVTELFHKEQSLARESWYVLVSENTHYSWLKALDLLGIGRNALVRIPCADDFTMDIHKLDETLTRFRLEKKPVLMIVSLFGSTEEGSLDDLPAVRSCLKHHARHGLRTWWHVDACYGGYLATLARSRSGPVSPETLITHLQQIARKFHVPRDLVRFLVESFSSQPGALDWSSFLDRIHGLKDADSISIDPHKLGYVPYPAGAVLLKEPDVWENVATEAPYLWLDESNRPMGTFVGRYTLEGSRPGAAAAACWLAHRAVPLTLEGHGQLISASMLATRFLYHTLLAYARTHPAIRVAILNTPHMNMLCYLPYHRDTQSLEELIKITRELADEFHPTSRHRSFMIVSTTLRVPVKKGLFRQWFGHTVGDRLYKQLRTASHVDLFVLRSVVMSPFALGSFTREGDSSVHLIESFTRTLFDSCERRFYRHHRTDILGLFTGKTMIPVLVHEDDNRKAMEELIERTIDSRTAKMLRFYHHPDRLTDDLKRSRHKIPFIITSSHTGLLRYLETQRSLLLNKNVRGIIRFVTPGTSAPTTKKSTHKHPPHYELSLTHDPELSLIRILYTIASQS